MFSTYLKSKWNTQSTATPNRVQYVQLILNSIYNILHTK